VATLPGLQDCSGSLAANDWSCLRKRFLAYRGSVFFEMPTVDRRRSASQSTRARRLLSESSFAPWRCAIQARISPAYSKPPRMRASTRLTLAGDVKRGRNYAGEADRVDRLFRRGVVRAAGARVAGSPRLDRYIIASTSCSSFGVFGSPGSSPIG
jgi:hypothetical protein